MDAARAWMKASDVFLPHGIGVYPPIERHGIIGDRRTAALVAADGTAMCAP